MPRTGVGAGLVLPRCNIQAMQWRLDEISFQVAPGAHAVVLLEQAGRHSTNKLVLPQKKRLLPPPPRSPELNPVENAWQLMRENQLSNRVFQSYDQILARCREAWNKLVGYPWSITSVGLRNWAHGF